jgi:hypothetical protein
MPSLSRPDVDLLEGLTTAIVVDQERMGANSRSTVGTATDANAMLRILFSRLGVPSAGPASHYSFTEPAGWCPRCEGRGTVNDIDLDELFDRDKSLAQGAITGHPQADRPAGDPQRDLAQPAPRERGHPARRALRGHRGRGVGQEFADPRVDAEGGGCRLDRPDADPRLAAQQPATYTGLLDPIRTAFVIPELQREAEPRMQSILSINVHLQSRDGGRFDGDRAQGRRRPTRSRCSSC